MKSFIQMWNEFQLKTAAESALKKATDDELNHAWQSWDGMALIHLGRTYIDERLLVIEMQKRGLECTY